MPKILLAVLVYDGDAYCREILLRTLSGLIKPPGTDLLLISDSQSPATTEFFHSWKSNASGTGFSNIELIEADFDEEECYEDFQGRFCKHYPDIPMFETKGLSKFLFLWNLRTARVIAKREAGRKFAIENGYDYLLCLDSDLNVESRALLKLLEMNCGVAAVLYPNVVLGPGGMIEAERVILFPEVFFKFLDEWSYDPEKFDRLLYDPRYFSVSEFKGQRYGILMLFDPREYARTKEVHGSIGFGGCVLYHWDILKASSFFRYETAPLIEAPDDFGFFLPLFFQGFDDVKVSLNVKAIHHVSNERKEFWKNQSDKMAGLTRYNMLHECPQIQFFAEKIP